MTSGYPLVLTNLQDRRCIVVGGGSIAERKTADLIAGGAKPTVISPDLTEGLEHLREQGKLEHLPRPYQSGDLAGAFLVIAATDKPEVNAAVAAEAQTQGSLVNLADAPDTSDFHTVGSVRRGKLLLSVSTGGASPALAARIKRDLETRYGSDYGVWLELLSELRDVVKQRLSSGERRCFWQTLTSPATLERLRAEGSENVRKYAYTLLSDAKGA